jgi:hypothetical protein
MKLLRDLWLLIRCYPVAKRSVTQTRDADYPGTVLTQIAYNETRTELVKRGWADDGITGAIVYIAISVAYLLNES